jgi:hypothetical protein
MNKFTLIWHLAFAPCAQLFALSPRFSVRSTLYALRPTLMKSTPNLYPLLSFSNLDCFAFRFHSFYPYHTGGDYRNLSNKKDEEMFHWIKEFK